jgi:uncharacterized protein (TIGR04255 family)
VEHYPKAPITEAVIGIQVKLANLPPQDTFLRLAGALAMEYPDHASLNQLQVNITQAVPPSPSAVAQTVLPSGVRITRPKNDRILHFQPSGMTFSHLPPYTSWKVFRSEGSRLWKRYVEFVKPVSVTRVALRYINQVDLPVTRLEFEDYFEMYPHAPDGIPQDINAFFMQVQIPNLPSDLVAVINFASAGQRVPGKAGVNLDIDVFSLAEMSCESEAVFKLLDVIRERKNHLFEACITDRTRELFR